MISNFQDWTWDLQQVNGMPKLVLNYVNDFGEQHSFVTHYKFNDLDYIPEPCRCFTIGDGRILTDCLQGLDSLNITEEMRFDLCFNALACANFVKSPAPMGRFFHEYGNCKRIQRGQVISVYSLEGYTGDFMVLDDNPLDGLYRLMLLNSKYVIGNHELHVGSMIKLSSRYICYFRSLNKSSKDRLKQA